MQDQTKKVFSEKWQVFEKSDSIVRTFNDQKKWFLSLYGYDSESSLAETLKCCPNILDAGCGLGYKSDWFAELSPVSNVIGVDISESVLSAQKNYRRDNLEFLRGSIDDTPFSDSYFDYVVCDQVIMHTDNPFQTLKELTRILKPSGYISVYFYRKKALPRELLDDHFRQISPKLSHDQLWELSRQLTDLGQKLDGLNVNFDCPDIPLLGIKEAKNISIQRFIYWNFLKCFWNEQLGYDHSLSTNFDWYAPSNAFRFSQDEVLDMAKTCCLDITYFHEEEACFSFTAQKFNVK